MFMAQNIARALNMPVETVGQVLAEAAREMRDDHPEAAETLEYAARRAEPVDTSAPTLPL